MAGGYVSVFHRDTTKGLTLAFTGVQVPLCICVSSRPSRWAETLEGGPLSRTVCESYPDRVAPTRSLLV